MDDGGDEEALSLVDSLHACSELPPKSDEVRLAPAWGVDKLHTQDVAFLHRVGYDAFGCPGDSALGHPGQDPMRKR